LVPAMAGSLVESVCQEAAEELVVRSFT
jgi:hypothetical protein